MSSSSSSSNSSSSSLRYEDEIYMLKRIESIYGHQYISKLDRMRLDMEHSHQVRKEYEQYEQHEQHEQCSDVPKLNINILSSGCWSFSSNHSPLQQMQLHVTMERMKQSFSRYYANSESKQKLVWLNHVGNVELLGHFVYGKKTLVTSVLQCSILMMFNDQKEVSFAAIRNQNTNVPEPVLKQHLLSLTTSRFRILNKKKKEHEHGDVFVFNENFKSATDYVKILLIKKEKEKKEEQEKKEKGEEEEEEEAVATVNNPQMTQELIDKRNLFLDSFIVRTMKKQRSIYHHELCELIHRTIMLSDATSIIKRRIENLIDRDFIERDKDDSTLYKYVM